MSVRKYSAVLGATALVVSGFALATVAPASADPTNPVFTPTATDIVGVGSDTIEGVVNDLAQGKGASAGWNAGNASQRVASFDATPQPSNITLRSAGWGGTADPLSIARPNGSGQGKATLFGAGNNNNVNFARSSSTLNAGNGEAAALTQFPFAVDGLKMAVSGNVASDAPATLTISDIVNIYKGTYKHWNEIPGNTGGSTAFIHPYIPQTGSGTRSFFLSELKAGNGGVDVTLAVADGLGYPGVSETQEHSPTDIQDNADAIAPFSTARAQTLASPGAIHLEAGYQAKRAVYIVVRNGDAGAAWVNSLFATTGYFCSTQAKSIIEADGFQQLATPANGGVCGVGTTTPVSNFTSNTVTTTTGLAATSPAGRQARLVATIDAGGASADGDVDFYEGATKVGTGLLTGGQSTLTLNGVTPGSHTYTAKFVSGNPAAFTDSTSADATVTVRETSTTTATVAPGTFGHGGSATVTVSSAAGTPTGNVTISVDGWQSTAALSNGTASFTVPGTVAAGSQSFSASYAGDATVAPSTDTKVYTVGQSGVTLAETFPAKVKAGKRGVGTIVVTIPSSSVKAGGTVVIKKGAKVVGRGTVVNGVATIKLAKLVRGKNKLVAAYSGSAGTLGTTLRFLIVQK